MGDETWRGGERHVCVGGRPQNALLRAPGLAAASVAARGRVLVLASMLHAEPEARWGWFGLVMFPTVTVPVIAAAAVAVVAPAIVLLATAEGQLWKRRSDNWSHRTRGR